MAKGRFIKNSFNAGEWSTLMDGRVDLAKYANAVQRLENCVIDPRGPAVFRPGLRYIAETKTSATASELIPFEFSADVGYIIEFGNLYVRFFKDQAQVEDGGSPVEVIMPYATADLAAIKYAQSADVLYLFHPSYPTRKLSRTSDTTWATTEINFNPLPTFVEPLELATTLTLDATTGTGINFTAGSSAFLSGDIGRIIVSGAGRASITSFTSGTVVVCEILDDFASVGPIASGSWEMQGSPLGTIDASIITPKGAITTITSRGTEEFTDLLDDGSNSWRLSSSGTAEYWLGDFAPFYVDDKPDKVYFNQIERTDSTVGSLFPNSWDWGDNDSLGYDTIYVRLGDDTDPDIKASTDESYVKRGDLTVAADVFRSTDVGKYVRMFSGFIKITTYTSAISVKGEILKEPTSTDETTNWILESDIWSAISGYPSCGVFFENRLFLAGSPSFPETVWGSVSGDYENFTVGIDDADSIQFTLAGRQISVIRWMETRDYLIIGCIGGEWRVGPDDSGAVLTPLNVTAKQRMTKGVANTLPVTVDSSTLYVQRSGRKIREFTFQFETDGYVAPDLNLLAEHITEGGIKEIVFQQEPLSILWCVRNDGKLIAMTYMREQDVIGWHFHETDGSVESIAVIHGEGYDELWAVVNRTIDGNTVRNVEMLEKFFSDSSETFKSNKGLTAFFVDSGITYNGAATKTITGLDHLEGEAVAVLADGSVVEGKTVASGQITLSTAASVVHVGMPYTGLIETMRFNATLQDGTAQSKLKRVIKMFLRVNESGPFKAGRDEDNLLPVTATAVGTTTGGGFLSLILGAVPDLFTGDIEYFIDDDFDREGRVTIVQDKPLPLSLLAIIAEVET